LENHRSSSSSGGNDDDTNSDNSDGSWSKGHDRRTNRLGSIGSRIRKGNVVQAMVLDEIGLDRQRLLCDSSSTLEVSGARCAQSSHHWKV